MCDIQDNFRTMPYQQARDNGLHHPQDVSDNNTAVHVHSCAAHNRVQLSTVLGLPALLWPAVQQDADKASDLTKCSVAVCRSAATMCLGSCSWTTFGFAFSGMPLSLPATLMRAACTMMTSVRYAYILSIFKLFKNQFFLIFILKLSGAAASWLHNTQICSSMCICDQTISMLLVRTA